MRSAIFGLVLASSALLALPTAAQLSTASGPAQVSGPADLCQELLAYAEKRAVERSGRAAAQVSAPAAVPPSRADTQASGTQGGGSIDPDISLTNVPETPAPPTVPVAPGAAPEPAISPHATGSSDDVIFKLVGDTTLQQVREAAQKHERQTCRNLTQTLRRAGADLPAALIALAAYEPDASKR